MRGVGTASGAVTVVNALPTGIGCAVAVSLPVLAEVDLRPTEGLTSHRIQVERTSDTALVRETLELRAFPVCYRRDVLGRFRIVSAVPIRKGLKSSSAVGGAVCAPSQAPSDSPAPRKNSPVSRLTVAQEIGLSATGASRRLPGSAPRRSSLDGQHEPATDSVRTVRYRPRRCALDSLGVACSIDRLARTLSRGGRGRTHGRRRHPGRPGGSRP